MTPEAIADAVEGGISSLRAARAQSPQNSEICNEASHCGRETIEAIELQGGRLRWVVTKENTNAQHCTMCVIQVQPGETVRPAHSHPNGEEVIYIVQGSGKMMIEGVVEPCMKDVPCLSHKVQFIC